MAQAADRQAVMRSLVVISILIATVLGGSYFGHDWSGPGWFAIVGGFALLGFSLFGLLNFALGFRLFPFGFYRYHFSILFSLGCTLTVYSAGSTTTPAVATYIPCIVLTTMLWGLLAGVLTVIVSILGYSAIWSAELMGWLPYAPFYPSKAPLHNDLHVATVAYLWMLAICLFSLLFSQYFKSAYDQRTEQREAAIAELRAANERLARMQRELARRESLAAVGTLAAGAAHEINNPLGSVYSLLQSLAEEVRDSAEVAAGAAQLDAAEWRVALGRAMEELRRARHIVQTLFELTEEREAAPEPFDFNTLVQEETERLSREHSLRPRLELGEGLPEVTGDRQRIGRALGQILLNAWEATQGQSEPRVVLTTTAAGRGVRLCCDDSGPGIAEGQREEIFRPFFTTRRERKAPGLGLYLVHHTAERCGGRTWAEPSRQGGARLCLEIPASPPEEVAGGVIGPAPGGEMPEA